MNIQEKLVKTKEKLQIITTLKEVVYSQVKYLEYSEKEIKLETKIKQLEEQIQLEKQSNKKIWIDMGNGWKKRINKTD